jgi:hypothetical protein
MLIEGLKLRGWLAHRRAEFAFRPMTVICGPNGSGKTSIRDGIGYAAVATGYRIDKKADRVKLISEGSTDGDVTVTIGGVSVTRDIESGKIAKPAQIPIGEGAVGEAVHVLLEPRLFGGMAPDERRELLLKVMRVAMTPAAIIAELKARGHQPDQVDKLKADGSIAEWIKQAETSASEARGAWKAVAGETYGGVKAETWKAPGTDAEKPDDAVLKGVASHLAAARSELEGLVRDLAEYDAAARHGTLFRDRAIAMRQQADHVPDLKKRHESAQQTKLEAARIEAEATSVYNDVVARLTPNFFDCPHCGSAVLVNAQGTGLEKFSIPKNQSTKDQEAAARAKLNAAKTATENAIADLLKVGTELVRAQEAADDLVGLGTAAEAPTGDRADIEAQIADARLSVERLEETHQAAKNAIDAYARGQERTTKASNYHAAVQAWTKLAADLAPTGIPGDLLAKALDPFNDTLRDQSAATKWRQPAIGADMAITAGGRPYQLLCESEQWRVDAQIAAAVAIHSGLKFVILDRFDVIEVPARKGALGWVYGLIKRDFLDTGLVLGTMQQPPQVPGDVGVIWLGEDQAEKVAA